MESSTQQIVRQPGGSPPNDPEFIRITRVARLLDVTRKRVYHLVRDGDLKAIRLGRRQMRIEKKSVEALIGQLLEEESEREP